MKLTNEEAAERIETFISTLVNGAKNKDGKEIGPAFNMGAAALRFQERHRWRNLSEEKPPEKGRYYTATPITFGDAGWFYQIMDWSPDKQKFYNGVGEHITHWAYIDPPEEEA